MTSNEKEWLEHSTKRFESYIQKCDFCGKTYPNTQVELVASWLFRINKLISNEIKFKNVGMDICVDCKTECLNNPDSFQFKIDLDLL